MNLLVIVANYPHAGHIYSGAFNESSVQALKTLGHQVTVLAPRPYVPRMVVACHPRWRAYRRVSAYEVRSGIAVYRPAYLQLPVFGGAFWVDRGAELFSARQVERLHRQKNFDAILSYDVLGAGGLAWRLARRLGIPAAGWATGNDVRVRMQSSYGRAVRRTLEQLDSVFYQSSELREQAANLLEVPVVQLPAERHLVLSRGIPPPPVLPEGTRAYVRSLLGLAPEQILVLYIGRIVAAKGVFDLAQAAAAVSAQHPALACVLVGAQPGFDDSDGITRILNQQPQLEKSVRLLPGCAHEQVWEYLAAADIFAFPSHSEGMPNSLLEAMAAGVPALAYAIPPITDIDGGRGVLKMARARDISDLSRALAELAGSSEQRADFARRGKQRVFDHYMAPQNLMEAVNKISSHLEKNAPAAKPAGNEVTMAGANLVSS